MILLKKTRAVLVSVMLVVCLALPAQLAYANPASESAELPSVVGSVITDEEVASALVTDDVGVMGIDDVDPVADCKGSISLFGETQYDTAAQEAIYAFSSSKYAIVASGISAVDALSATSLAGALDCPILLTAQTHLPDGTADALSKLGVTDVIVVGGSYIVQQSVVDSIKDVTGKEPVRIAGESLFDTQMEVYKYGQKNKLWGDMAIIANGSKSFADALSISPIAYKQKAPVFLTDDDGLLPLDNARELISGGFNRVVAVGGEAVVAEQCMGIAEAAAIMGGGSYGSAHRIAGETLYDTSAEVARWAVSEGILKWDGAAFTTGKVPYDALAGSAVQGKEGSVLLLIDEGYRATLDAALINRESIEFVKFFGGNAVVSPQVREDVIASLSLANISLSYQEYGITLDALADLEVKAVSSAIDYTKDDILAYLDPGNYEYGKSSYYVFADLSKGYSGMTAQQMDAFIAATCTYSESRYGVSSTMRGMGAAFVEAAKTYNVNEVYLLAHAAVESAWGCSMLAQGYEYDGATEVGGKLHPKGTYYNFYGIGAYDSSPLSGGRAMAVKNGWDTPEAAIVGAAKWISEEYTHAKHSRSQVSGQQKTLWQMRWDAQGAATNGSVWHQYATSVTWATGIAQTMGSFYRYAGIDFDRTGFNFVIPVFV